MNATSSSLVTLLVVPGLFSFGCAVWVGIKFRDTLGATGIVMAVAAGAFGVAALLMAFAGTRARGVLFVAAVLAALACGGAGYAAVDAGLRYSELRRQIFAGRGGVRLVEPDSDPGRRMLAAMFGSIAAALAAITTLPLPPVLVFRAIRSSET